MCTHKRLTAMASILLLAAVSVAISTPAEAAAPTSDFTAGMKLGSAELKSIGPIAFGPQGVLFIGDPDAATVYAIDTSDRGPRSAGALNVKGINKKVAALLGTSSEEIQIVDLAINPESGNAYLAVTRGRGPGAKPVIARVGQDGSVSELELDRVRFSTAELLNPPIIDANATPRQRSRRVAVTDINYTDGLVIVSGVSNEEFSSNLCSIPFPFSEVQKGASVEIFHGSHGRLETNSPVQTFIPFSINDEPHILAAYICTPLVTVPISDLRPGAHVRGTTVAELGNRNRPLDMIVYNKGGHEYILMANSARGVMKIPTEGIADIAGITERIPDKAGLTYETIESLTNVMQLDRFDDANAVIMTRSADSGRMDLATVELP